MWSVLATATWGFQYELAMSRRLSHWKWQVEGNVAWGRDRITVLPGGRAGVCLGSWLSIRITPLPRPMTIGWGAHRQLLKAVRGGGGVDSATFTGGVRGNAPRPTARATAILRLQAQFTTRHRLAYAAVSSGISVPTHAYLNTLGRNAAGAKIAVEDLLHARLQ